MIWWMGKDQKTKPRTVPSFDNPSHTTSDSVKGPTVDRC